MNAPRTAAVLCIGEVLWDVFPDHRCLGGAPFNVACHLRALGVETAIVSRVGSDPEGSEILDLAEAHGLPRDLLQVDDALPTGRVTVTLGAQGVPSYRIEAPAAWDAIEASAAARSAASRASAIVYGTLAQRRPRSRGTLRELLRSSALKVLDVNLRPPHDDRACAEMTLYRSDMVKLNDAEMDRLCDWFEIAGRGAARIAALARRFGLSAVCVTRGDRGASLWRHGRLVEHDGFAVTVEDTVGSGDAFLAALLARLLAGEEPEVALAWANATGAFVAARRGATPELDLGAIGAMVRESLAGPMGAGTHAG